MLGENLIPRNLPDKIELIHNTEVCVAAKHILHKKIRTEKNFSNAFDEAKYIAGTRNKIYHQMKKHRYK